MSAETKPKDPRGYLAVNGAAGLLESLKTAELVTPAAPAPDQPNGTPERKPLSHFLVNHGATLGMSWEQIEALRPPYVIDGIGRRGEVILMGAESKSRKSWLAQDAGFSVAAGTPWLADENGENGFPTARAHVHVVDLELDPSEMLFRFAKARGNRFFRNPEAAEMASSNFTAYSFDGLNVLDILPRIEEIQETVSPGDLVIVDCLYRLVPDGNETADVARILEFLKRFAKATQAAVILIDHFRKAGDDKARNRFAGSFVKQAGPSTLVAIETKSDDILVLNIDARTFHGCPVTHARFNLETYTFDRVPEEDVKASKDAASAAESEGWLIAVWKSRPLSYAAVVTDGAEKWGLSRQGASARFPKLEARGLVSLSENKAGHAKKWILTPNGVETVKAALDLHPKLQA